MRAVNGLLCKIGAEGVYAVGLADGTGIALKVEDGTPRARKVVMAATLHRLGLANETIENHSTSTSPAAATWSAKSAARTDLQLTSGWVGVTSWVWSTTSNQSARLSPVR